MKQDLDFEQVLPMLSQVAPVRQTNNLVTNPPSSTVRRIQRANKLCSKYVDPSSAIQFSHNFFAIPEYGTEVLTQNSIHIIIFTSVRGGKETLHEPNVSSSSSHNCSYVFALIKFIHWYS